MDEDRIPLAWVSASPVGDRRPLTLATEFLAVPRFRPSRWPILLVLSHGAVLAIPSVRRQRERYA
jgi:hypothetical protein